MHFFLLNFSVSQFTLRCLLAAALVVVSFLFHDVHRRTKKSSAKKLCAVSSSSTTHSALLLAEFSVFQITNISCVVVAVGSKFFPFSIFPLAVAGCCWCGVQKTFVEKALRVLCVLFYVFFCDLIFLKLKLSPFHFVQIALFHFSENVSYRWIATLRRLGCNLFCCCRFKSSSWEILHQIY